MLFVVFSGVWRFVVVSFVRMSGVRNAGVGRSLADSLCCLLVLLRWFFFGAVVVLVFLWSFFGGVVVLFVGVAVVFLFVFPGVWFGRSCHGVSVCVR